MTHPIIHPPTLALNDTHLNSFFDPLEIGPELTMDYHLDNFFYFLHRSLTSLYPALCFCVAL